MSGANGGYVVFTQLRVEIGDILYVFNGSPVPHVIRRAANQAGGAYQLVGDAYVQGLMEGEVYSKGIQEEDVLLVREIPRKSDRNKVPILPLKIFIESTCTTHATESRRIAPPN